MLLTFWRIIKFSLQDITRNVWLTMATVTILVLALFSVNVLLTVRVISDNAVAAVKDKVNISLYLKPEVTDAEAMALRAEILNISNVKEIRYTSKVEALRFFREKNRSNPEILQALQELGRNPLSPSLVIIPQDTEAAPELIEKIKRLDSSIIESRDFSDNSLLLTKINNVTKRVNEVGLFIILIFIATSLLVAYNSIKVAIYTHRREIEIMRLVGASNRFIYLPFILSGVIYALLSTLIIIFIFYTFLGLLQPYLEVFFTGYNVNIIDYFINNFWSVFGWEFLIGMAISVLASLLAIRKYARV